MTVNDPKQPSSEPPTLDYRTRPAKEIGWWVRATTATNEKAVVSLLCTIVASLLHGWCVWVGPYYSYTFRQKNAFFLALFIAVPLAVFAVMMAIAGFAEREGRMWPGWMAMGLIAIQVMMIPWWRF